MTADNDAPVILRRFADLAHGQMHYRMAGDGAPMLVIHASPGSSKQQAGLIADMADVARVIAPDTPGNGDSDPLPLDTPAIADLAQAYLGLLDALGLEQVRVYGSHTGAAIGAELAIAAPDRVERLVLDGVQVLTQEARAEVLARYAAPFTPDLEGAYLMRAFMFCRDQYLFYPWYNRTTGGQRKAALPHPRDLNNWVVEVLKGAETYHLNYQAAFNWRAPDRLPLVECPTLVLAAENDPLLEDSREVRSALRDGRFVPLPRFDAADYRSLRKSLIAGFLELN
jgi:pimeloyl-ACP methyl ester carboxylesterase